MSESARLGGAAEPFSYWAGMGHTHLLPRVLLIPCSLWWGKKKKTGGTGITSLWSSSSTTAASRFILWLSKQEGLLAVSLGVREAGFQATEPRKKSYSKAKSYSERDTTDTSMFAD